MNHIHHVVGGCNNPHPTPYPLPATLCPVPGTYEEKDAQQQPDELPRHVQHLLLGCHVTQVVGSSQVVLTEEGEDKEEVDVNTRHEK